MDTAIPVNGKPSDDLGQDLTKRVTKKFFVTPRVTGISLR